MLCRTACDRGTPVRIDVPAAPRTPGVTVAMQFGHHFDGWNYGWLGVPAMRARANESVIPAAEREAFMARYKAAASCARLLATMWLVAISKYRHAGEACAWRAACQKAALPGSVSGAAVALM
jgi:hypothetical protein